MNTLISFLTLGSILSGILVITLKNPVILVLFLISVFVHVSGYLILLGMHFIGLTYLIVYVGAIAILFLFVVMMMNIKIVEITEVGKEYTQNLPLGAIVGIIFLIELWGSSFQTQNYSNLMAGLFDRMNLGFRGIPFETTHGLGLGGQPNTWDSLWDISHQLEAIGQTLYSTYAIWFIIGSFILLLAMVGPILLTFKSKTLDL